MRKIALSLLALSLALPVGTGCVSATSEDDLESAGDELRALTDAEIVGTLAPGETKSVEAAPKPFYRAFALTVAAGERLELTVRSEDGAGDPQAWLLGSSFQTLARSTDVSSSDASARFERTIKKAGTYYLAIRDERSRTVTFTVSRGGASVPQPARCTSDAQCGGGSAMCFIDRCATVSESSFSVAPSSRDGDVVAAYTPGGELRVAYQTWRFLGYGYGQQNPHEYTVFEGPFGRATGDGGGSSSRGFSFDRAPGFEPVLSTWGYGSSSVGYGGWGGPRLGQGARVNRFAVGRNGAGTLFIAISETTKAPANSNANDSCSLWFSSRKGGFWSAPELVDRCIWDGYRDLAVHVRKDGTADVVAADDRGIVRYHRSNPIDPWAKTSLVVGQGRGAFASAHGVEGTTHLVTQPYVFTRDASFGDYMGTYVELGDEGTVRSIPLSKHDAQVRRPFWDLEEDGEGNVWIQKRTREAADSASIVRIDRAGNVAERSLGRMATGDYRFSTLAVSRAGEVSIVHGGNLRDVSLRRFTPVK